MLPLKYAKKGVHKKLNLNIDNINNILESNILIRTGTIGDGSCFFHSLLHSINSGSYPKLPESKQIEQVEVLRKNLSNNLTKDQWYKLGDMDVSFEAVSTSIRNFFDKVYDYLNNPGQELNKHLREILTDTFFKNCKEHYELITQILPYEDTENKDAITIDNVLGFSTNECYKKQRELGIDFDLLKCMNIFKKMLKNSFIDNLEKIVGQSLDEKKKKYIINKFVDLSELIIDKSVDSSFNEYKANLSNKRCWVDHSMISYLSDYFDKDIYFIDGNTRKPYLLGPCNYKKRESIIILWIGGSHYESVALVANKNASRVFPPDNPLIKQLYYMLCIEPNKKYEEKINSKKKENNEEKENSEKEDSEGEENSEDEEDSEDEENSEGEEDSEGEDDSEGEEDSEEDSEDDSED